MAKYDEQNYTLPYALENIGNYFWQTYQADLLLYAKDRSRKEIVERIHREWDKPGIAKPNGTNIRIDWALAIYDHGDWEKSLTMPVPDYRKSSVKADPGRKNVPEFCSDSGVAVRSVSELCIANWLYFHQIPFEYERPVPFAGIEKPVHCDFYLPEKDVYIEFWGMMKDEGYRQYQAWKEPLYHKNGYTLLSLYPEDLKNLREQFAVKLREVTEP